MARWQPDAAERLVGAALDLFIDKGYESTTVIEIAERAGVTKSTFFRHFPDKREVLFGGDAFGRRVAEAVAAVPAGVGPLDAVAAAFDTVGREAFTPARREFSARRRAVIAANRELQEREALKGRRLAAALDEALRARDVPEPTARLAAEIGTLTLAIAYERWSGSVGGEEFGPVARAVLDDLRRASASLR